jgi:hypothetical protein
VARRAQTRDGRFIEVGWAFHGVLVGSKVFLPLRWMMLEKVPRDVASRCSPYLVAEPSNTGVDVDRLACPQHHPMTSNYYMRG